jgi:hypothetical protein
MRSMRLLSISLLLLAACAGAPARAPVQTTTSVRLFYPDERNGTCEALLEVARPLASRDADVVLRALLAGPTHEEVARGAYDPFARSTGGPAPPLARAYLGVMVRGRKAVVRWRGEAMAYLNSAICAQGEVKGSIEATLRALGIDDVDYEVDGVIVREWDA